MSLLCIIQTDSQLDMLLVEGNDDPVEVYHRETQLDGDITIQHRLRVTPQQVQRIKQYSRDDDDLIAA